MRVILTGLDGLETILEVWSDLKVVLEDLFDFATSVEGFAGLEASLKGVTPITLTWSKPYKMEHKDNMCLCVYI